MTNTEFAIHQNVFIVFFAIFWGAVANVQPRWKAFQWPLIFKMGEVFRRVALAVLVMNVLPVIYFAISLWVTHDRGPTTADSPGRIIAVVVFQGVLPAFGIFAIYRLWLGIIELRPQWFYKRNAEDVPKPYRHVEPTYRISSEENKTNGLPFVDLGEDAGWRNIAAVLFYLFVAQGAPWLFQRIVC